MENEEILFTNIMSIENKNKIYSFHMKDGTVIEKYIENATKFVDPSCASVFEMLFLDSNQILNENGQTRLLHLLNSLIIQKNGDKFIKIEKLPNEKHNLSSNLYNILKFGITFKATLSSKNEFKTIELEMQLGNDQSNAERLFRRGSYLFSEYDKNTIVLSFINKKENSDKYKSFWGYLNKSNNKGENVKLDFFETVVINLNEELMKIKKNSNVYVRNMKLGKDGINWIKLLGIRNWETPYNNYYYLPKNIKFSSNQIASAFEILKSFDELSYEKLLREEEYAYSLIQTSKEEGRKEGKEEGREEGRKEGRSEGLKEGRENYQIDTLIKLFRNDFDNIDKILDIIIDDDMEIKYEKIKSKFKNDVEKSQQFVNWLGRKKRISFT